MFNSFISVLLAVSAPDLRPQAATSPAAWANTRPLSPGTIELLAIAAERSSIIRGLLMEIEQSDVVVYVTDSMPEQTGGPMSYLVFLSGDKAVRYLLVRIDRWRLSPSEKIVALGHELQHALEVATAAEVTNAIGLAQLYRRIGWEGQTDRFETASARDISIRIRGQLSRRSTRSPHKAEAPDIADASVKHLVEQPNGRAEPKAEKVGLAPLPSGS